jgi:hypothetical protein
MTTIPPTLPIECTSRAQFESVVARSARPGRVTCLEVQHDAHCTGTSATCACHPHLLLHDLSVERPVLLARLLAPTLAGDSA